MKFCPFVIIFYPMPFNLLSFYLLLLFGHLSFDPMSFHLMSVNRFLNPGPGIKLYSLPRFRLKRSVYPLHSQVFQFQHFGCFDRVVKHQKCNLKASKTTFVSIKSKKKRSNLMPYSLFLRKY